MVSGAILQRTGGDWNQLLYVMTAAAAVSAVAWLYLDPDDLVNPWQAAFASTNFRWAW